MFSVMPRLALPFLMFPSGAPLGALLGHDEPPLEGGHDSLEIRGKMERPSELLADGAVCESAGVRHQHALVRSLVLDENLLVQPADRGDHGVANRPGLENGADS